MGEDSWNCRSGLSRNVQPRSADFYANEPDIRGDGCICWLLPFGMEEHTVSGFLVTCTDDPSGNRVWHCNCAEYERQLLRFGESFCEHVVVAIERAHAVHTLTAARAYRALVASRALFGPD